jgi:hypothetical protein
MSSPRLDASAKMPLHLLFCWCMAWSFAFAGIAEAQSVLEGPQYQAVLQRHYSRTNQPESERPFLVMDWFPSAMSVEFSSVTKSGLLHSGVYIHNRSVRGTGTQQLSSNRQDDIAAWLSYLPKTPDPLPPQEQWLIVSCEEKNQWTTRIYDRADLPFDLLKVYDLLGLRLMTEAPQAVVKFTNSISPRKDVRAIKADAANPWFATMFDGGAQMWDLRTGAEIKVPGMMAGRWAAPKVLASSGMVFISSEEVVRCVNLEDGEILWQKGGKFGSRDASRQVLDMAMMNLGQHLAVVLPKSVEIWSAKTGERERLLCENNSGFGVMASTDWGKHLAVSGSGGVILMFDEWYRQVNTFYAGLGAGFGDSGKRLAQLTNAGSIRSMAMSQDASHVAFITSDGSFKVWTRSQTTPRTIRCRLLPSLERLAHVVWGKQLAVISDHGLVVIYEPGTWKTIGQWRSPGANQTVPGFLAASSQGELLVLNGHSKIYGIEAPKPVAKISMSKP